LIVIDIERIKNQELRLEKLHIIGKILSQLLLAMVV